MIPTNLKEATKIGVTVLCESSKSMKLDKVYIETESLLGASRIVNTFKPKRGYVVAKIVIEEVKVFA